MTALSEASIIQLRREGELAVLGVGPADFLVRWSEGAVCVPDLMLDEEDDGYPARLAACERFGSWAVGLGLKRETADRDLQERRRGSGSEPVSNSTRRVY